MLVGLWNTLVEPGFYIVIHAAYWGCALVIAVPVLLSNRQKLELAALFTISQVDSPSTSKYRIAAANNQSGIGN
jgi:hypothetical protein